MILMKIIIKIGFMENKLIENSTGSPNLVSQLGPT